MTSGDVPECSEAGEFGPSSTASACIGSSSTAAETSHDEKPVAAFQLGFACMMLRYGQLYFQRYQGRDDCAALGVPIALAQIDGAIEHFQEEASAADVLRLRRMVRGASRLFQRIVEMTEIRHRIPHSSHERLHILWQDICIQVTSITKYHGELIALHRIGNLLGSCVIDEILAEMTDSPEGCTVANVRAVVDWIAKLTPDNRERVPLLRRMSELANELEAFGVHGFLVRALEKNQDDSSLAFSMLLEVGDRLLEELSAVQLAHLGTAAQALPADHGETEPVLGQSRLTVDVENNSATFDGKLYPLRKQCAFYLDGLVKCLGCWVAPRDIKAIASKYNGRTARNRNGLPKPIRALIESRPGTGTRIPSEKLA